MSHREIKSEINVNFFSAAIGYDACEMNTEYPLAGRWALSLSHPSFQYFKCVACVAIVADVAEQAGGRQNVCACNSCKSQLSLD